MRITDSLKNDTLLRNVDTSLTNYNTVQQQISTGKKLTRMSDDPTGGSQSLLLHAELVDNAQYQSNTDAATSFLNASDSALNSANSLLQSASQIALQGANGSQNATDLQALGNQVDGIIRQLTQVANSDLHGKYLFAGTKTQNAPFVAPTAGSDPTPSYVGDTGTVTATIGKNDSIGLSTPGSVTFGSAFTALQTLRTDLQAGNQSAVSADVDKVNAAGTVIISQQAAVGARTNEVSDVKQRLTRAQGEYQDSISNIEDVDLAQAYVQLQSTQNVYQASLATTAKAFQYSLTDYLK